MISVDFIINNFFLFVLSLLLLIIFIYAHKNKYLIFNKQFEKQIQDIHEKEVSRLGGVVILIAFYLVIYLQNYTNLIFFSMFVLVALIPALIEDLRFKIKPKLRLLLIFTSSFLIVLSIEDLPIIDIDIFFSLLNNYYLKIIFFTIGISTLVNGQNMIDGANGLSAFSAICSFLCLLYLGYHISDIILIEISIFMISMLVCFLIFNYPFGKIFLGDTGSYFIGFIIGYLIINIYGKYQYLPTWSALIIIYYPILEVIFSYFRKIIQKKSPFYADDKHLHLKIFFLISRGKNKSRLFNSLVSPFMSFIWITPITIFPLTLRFPKISILGVLFITIIYLFFYFAVPYKKSSIFYN